MTKGQFPGRLGLNGGQPMSKGTHAGAFCAECNTLPKLKALNGAARCVNCSLLNANDYDLYEHRLERSEFSLMIHGCDASSCWGQVPVLLWTEDSSIMLSFCAKLLYVGQNMHVAWCRNGD